MGNDKNCEHEWNQNDDTTWCKKCHKYAWEIKIEALEQKSITIESLNITEKKIRDLHKKFEKKIEALEQVLRDFFEVMKAYACTEISDEVEILLKMLEGEQSVSRRAHNEGSDLQEPYLDSADSTPSEPSYYCQDCDQFLTGEQYMLHNSDHWIEKRKKEPPEVYIGQESFDHRNEMKEPSNLILRVMKEEKNQQISEFIKKLENFPAGEASMEDYLDDLIKEYKARLKQ